MENLVQEKVANTTDEESDVDEEFDIYLPSNSPKIKSYREATIIRGHSDLFR